MKKITLTLCSLPFLLALYLLLPGCSGGTTGTGGLGVSGRLVATTGTSGGRAIVAVPIPGAKITVVGTNDSDITDDAGNFFIFTEKMDATVTLSIQTSSFNSTYEIQNIPSAAVTVNLDLEYEVEQDDIISTSTKYEDKDGNEID